MGGVEVWDIIDVGRAVDVGPEQGRGRRSGHVCLPRDYEWSRIPFLLVVSLDWVTGNGTDRGRQEEEAAPGNVPTTQKTSYDTIQNNVLYGHFLV